MKLLNIILKGTLVMGLFTGISAIAMQKEPIQLKLGGSKSQWYKDALAKNISSPLKLKTINQTGYAVKTIQQGRGNLWWAQIPNGQTFDNNGCNMDGFTNEVPQYTFKTADNVYILNFEKNAPYFKAVLERLDIEKGLAQNRNDNEVLTLTKLVNKLPVADIEKLVQGDVLTVTLTDIAQMTKSIE